jgi:radical SAM superfamily enzyme YgiQ (UPF0313 family)
MAVPSQRVVLINPPPLRGRTNERTFSGGIGVSRKLKPFEREAPQLPPIDLLYLAAVAEKASARVGIVDLLAPRDSGATAERRCLDAVGDERGAHVWIGVRLSLPSLPQDLEFAERVKNLFTGCRVFLFGSAILSSIDSWIRACTADYVLFGEPEAFFDRVLRASDPSEVPGVVVPWRWTPLEGADRFDRARSDQRRAAWVLAADLSALPRPAWHLLDLRRYAGAHGEVGVHVQASRGCPIGCSMCPYALIEGETWRKNDVARVVQEVAFLNRELGIHRVRFRDANFGFSRKYAVELAEALLAAGVRLDASVETSVEVFDEPSLRKLYAAGIRTITTGVETNDDACMASIGQRIQVNPKIRERVDLCHRIGFHVYGTYCLGMPEETWDTVEKTWRFARELDVESGFTVLTPFPGTPMYFRALEEGLLERDVQFSRWNSYTATVRTYALTTRDLDVARTWARLETILPYRRKRAAAKGALALLGFYARHLPHHALRLASRGYVWVRRRTAASLRPARA